VVAGVVETSKLRADLVSALGGCSVQTVRLVSRLTATSETADATDFTVANDRAVDEVARKVVTLAGWLADSAYVQVPSASS
jgi:hypothetical protein